MGPIVKETDISSILQRLRESDSEFTFTVVQPSGELADVIAGSDNIRNYLQGLLAGRPMTPRSWFYEKVDPAELVAEVKQHLETSAIRSPYSEEIKQFDLAYESKFGPQGGIPPLAETLDTVVRGFKRNPVDYNDPSWQLAKRNVIKRLGLRRQLKPWSYDRVIADMRTRNRITRYAGFPTGGKKSDPRNQTLAKRDALNGKWKTYPAMLLFRFYKGKLRMVWMMPYSAVLVGGSYTNPLMAHLRSLGLPDFSQWEGFEFTENALTKIWDPAADLAFGGDTSAMDEHMTIVQEQEVYDVLKEGFSERDWPLLWEYLQYESSVPLLIQPDIMLTGDHGKASGGTFTQLSETIYQEIVEEYATLVVRRKLKGLLVIGDDYVRIAQGKEPLGSTLVDIYARFGLPGKIEKQSDRPDLVTYCQRLFVKDWWRRGTNNTLGGIYALLSALRSCVWPENWVDPEDYPGHFSDMFVTKIAMIVENTINHPEFVWFCKWAGRSQKDIIPFAKQASAKIDKIWEKSKSVRGIGESYNQEKQDKPLSSYECIKIWRSM
nr:MAG: RNA-dependent RNA polymerase [Porcine picobirnavirus]